MALLYGDLTGRIVGAAVEVHRHLGPGLLERAYQRCLVHELVLRGLPVRCEVSLDLDYKGLHVPRAYRLDSVVDERVVIEVKTVDAVSPIHVAQLLTYLRLSRMRVGLILNFKVDRLRDGIVRRVL